MSQAGIITGSGGGGGGVTSVTADTGAAVPLAGVLRIDSATAVGGVADNITTAASGNTVTVALKNNISQPDTNAAGTTGMYSLGGYSFMHNYGTNNAFLGQLAGNLTLTANDTTAIGDQAGRFLATAGYTVFIGSQAGTNIANSNENVAVGSASMQGTGTDAPSYNVALGALSLRYPFGAAGNVALGQNSLMNAAGNYNVAIGYLSGTAYTTSESNNICISNTGIVGESNNIHIGTQGTQTACTIAGIAGVSTANSQLVTINSSTGQLGSQAIQMIMTWTAVGASGALVPNNGYLATSGAALSFSLPATAAVGTQIGLVLAGSTSWAITQGAGQSITVSPTTTTIGVGGSVTSLTAGSTLTLICDVANTHWTAIASTGTFTIV